MLGFVWLLLSVCVFVAEGQTAKRCLAGASVLGRGYNLVFSNPHLVSLGKRQLHGRSDPGYREQILEFSCDQDGTEADQVRLESYIVCRAESYREIITGMDSYQKLMLANVFFEYKGQLCKRTRLGNDYTGKLDVTKSNKKCIPWARHLSTIQRKTGLTPGDVLKMENFCRNPDWSGEGPWCYYGDGAADWDYCQLPFCAPKINSKTIRQHAFMGQTLEDPETESNLHFETKTTCKIMRASFTDDKTLRLKGFFKRRLCDLPDEYDEKKYMDIIDDFGTHIITSVELGITLVERQSSSKTAVFRRLMEQDLARPLELDGEEYFAIKVTDIKESDLVDHGILNDPFKMSIGTIRHNTLTNRDDVELRPVNHGLYSIDELFIHPAFISACEKKKKIGKCCKRAPELRRNLWRALEGYAEYKKLQKAREELPVFGAPAEWPPGIYMIPANNDKGNTCPTGKWIKSSMTLRFEHSKMVLPKLSGRTLTSIFKSGLFPSTLRKRDTKTRSIVRVPGIGKRDTNNDVAKRGLINWDTKKDEMKQTFCLRDKITTTEYNWPAASYCLYRYGQQCPKGFSTKTIAWNDNQNFVREGFPLPDHNKSKPKRGTQVHMCCMNERQTTSMLLPTSKQFNLLKGVGACPRVHGMVSSLVITRPKCRDHRCIKMTSYLAKKQSFKRPVLCRYRKKPLGEGKTYSRVNYGYGSNYNKRGSMLKILRWNQQ